VTVAVDPLVLLGSFLLGAVPFALLLGLSRGVDLRRVGSGNVGATNLGRSAGLGWGFVAFLLDAAKGALPTLFVATAGFASAADPAQEGAAVLAGGATVLGHCFSPFLRFRGGKGVATMAGVLLALAPGICLPLLLVWGGLVAWRRNIGLASVGAAAAALLTGIGLAAGSAGTPRPWLATLLIALPVVVIARHRSNLRRIIAERKERS